MEHKPILQMKNIIKTLGKKTVVNDISLDIYPGEVFGFLGPNGAGKTTTIRMLVGLMSMTEGKIFIKGMDIEKNFEKAIAEVGAIVENPELYDHLTGYQNLIHFSRMAGGISKDRIHEVIELVGLEKTIHDKVKTYSLGMRQRLGLAQALIHSPSVLILDEPTNGLDPAGIREFREHLKKLTQVEGMAVFVSSHMLAEMELMCDRIGIIQQGKLINVHSVHDYIRNKGDLAVTLTVDPLTLAEQVIQEEFPEVLVTLQKQTIEIHIDYEQIPQVVKCLVEQEVKIYGIQTIPKTLEDMFIELTGGQQIV